MLYSPSSVTVPNAFFVACSSWEDPPDEPLLSQLSRILRTYKVKTALCCISIFTSLHFTLVSEWSLSKNYSNHNHYCQQLSLILLLIRRFTTCTVEPFLAFCSLATNIMITTTFLNNFLQTTNENGWRAMMTVMDRDRANRVIDMFRISTWKHYTELFCSGLKSEILNWSVCVRVGHDMTWHDMTWHDIQTNRR